MEGLERARGAGDGGRGVAAVKRRRRDSTQLSLSATDADWAMVEANAVHRRMSKSRYVRALVLGDGFEAPEEGPTVALDADEQRALYETVRTLPALMRGEADGASLVEDVRTRIAVVLDAWAAAMAREGRLEELRAVLVARVGAEMTERIVRRFERRRAESEPVPEPSGDAGPGAAPAQGGLFC